MTKKKTDEVEQVEQTTEQTTQEGAEGADPAGEEAGDTQQPGDDTQQPAADETGDAEQPAGDVGEATAETLTAEEAIDHLADLAAEEELLDDDEDGADLEPMNKLEQNDLHPAQDGSLRTSDGKVAWAPPGTATAAANGVQQDASGSFTSTNCPNTVRP